MVSPITSVEKLFVTQMYYTHTHTVVTFVDWNEDVTICEHTGVTISFGAQQQSIFCPQ